MDVDQSNSLKRCSSAPQINNILQDQTPCPVTETTTILARWVWIFFLLAVCRVYLIAQGTTNHSVILCQSICTTSSSLLDEFQSINGQSVVKSCAENFTNSSRGVRSADSEGGQSRTWGPFCDADLTKLRRLDTHHGDMVIQRGTGQ